MAGLTKTMERLIQELVKLPGVGPKTAERLAFHILKMPKEQVERLALAISEFKDNVGYCGNCFNLSEAAKACQVCDDISRDKSIVCVVERPADIVAIEKAGSYRGIYHVLLGALSPLDNIGPDDLKIKELLARIERGGIKEIVLATNSNQDGEITALYLTKLIKPMGVKLTRIAYGIPVGANLEYTDRATLGIALEGRREI